MEDDYLYPENCDYPDDIHPECDFLEVGKLWHGMHFLLTGTAWDAGREKGDKRRKRTWLLECDKSPSEDPCWETREWADTLKADAQYRLGVSLQKAGKKHKAEQCYRQYLELLFKGIEGSYSSAEVTRRIRSLHGARKRPAAKGELRKPVNRALQTSGRDKRGGAAPTFSEAELAIGGNGRRKR